MKKSILTSLVLIAFAFTANAQDGEPVDVVPPGLSTTAAHTVKVTATTVLDISMTSIEDVTFDFDTPEKYETGIVHNAATELKVKSTKPWVVRVTGGSENFSSLVEDNSTELPVSALEIGATVITPAVEEVVVEGVIITEAVPESFGAATFVALTSTNPGTEVKTGSKGGNGVSGNTFKLDYKMNPGYIAHDTYSMTVTYTITQE